MALTYRWPFLLEERFFHPEAVFPLVNIYDDGRAFLVRAEIPGVNKDSLEISAQQAELTLRGERVAFLASKDTRCLRRERDDVRFTRTVTLPQPVDADHVEATYKNGVLEVLLPRVPERQPRKIQVN